MLGLDALSMVSGDLRKSREKSSSQIGGTLNQNARKRNQGNGRIITNSC